MTVPLRTGCPRLGRSETSAWLGAWGSGEARCVQLENGARPDWLLRAANPLSNRQAHATQVLEVLATLQPEQSTLGLGLGFGVQGLGLGFRELHGCVGADTALTARLAEVMAPPRSTHAIKHKY